MRERGEKKDTSKWIIKGQREKRKMEKKKPTDERTHCKWIGERQRERDKMKRNETERERDGRV